MELAITLHARGMNMGGVADSPDRESDEKVIFCRNLT
jgi:hypothetical protein